MTKLKITLFLAILVFSLPSFAAPCGANLNGLSKPNQKTLTAGALLRLKPQLKKVIVHDNGYTGTEPTSHILAYTPEVPLHAEKVYELLPNEQLRTLTGVIREGNLPLRVKVEILPSGERAVMYWADIYNNAFVELAGETKPEKPKIVRHKFPNSWDRFNQEKLWSQGQTAWGRPKAKIGQMVWIANHSRAMGSGSVGILESADEADNWATVKTLGGATAPAYYWSCVPLTEEEISWFK